MTRSRDHKPRPVLRALVSGAAAGLVRALITLARDHLGW
ncbi:hypothetical protein BC739_002265 [Kutzneria viridogrisea]|uniref:Uncharacterized protein n=2 Tax=Kutzneria TaxID=43356 RepID=W5WGK7_9PSEU|nr:hypothetical protein KALB_6526 [Kutzneria albida DSM 43870]MBA8925066.1 hypothetical protein [Kutzneria viridogrisea]